MKESAFSVCNPLVFLFVFHRAEVDMVSTEPRVFWGGFLHYICGFNAVNVPECAGLCVLFSVL